jgi:hypothetical protein
MQMSLFNKISEVSKMPEKRHFKLVFLILAIFLLFSVLKQMMFQTTLGYIYVYQNILTGSLSVFTEPGVHFRTPFFSSVTEYKQVATVSFGAEDGEALTRILEPITVRFADTYTGQIPITFRFRLPTDPQKIIQTHREFRTFENLVDALLVRNARSVTVNTAAQYTGEEFFQGGLTLFKADLEDQLTNGVYVTERRQVEIDQLDIAPVGLEQEESHKLQRSKQIVWKTVPILDQQGNRIRANNPLAPYGIEATQVTLNNPHPEEQLSRLLVDKKTLVAERIKTIQEQETAKAQAKTEQLKKEIERTKAVQDAHREKELAVIAQQREVEVAKQIAEKSLVEQRKLKDMAVIDREKELSISQANREIQKANSEAAAFEAQAILQKGKAENEVLAAKYAARGTYKDIFLAEIQRDIAQTLYTNLPNFKVEMPSNYVSTGNGENKDGLKTNLDVISAFSALGLMKQMSELPSAPLQTPPLETPSSLPPAQK